MRLWPSRIYRGLRTLARPYKVDRSAAVLLLLLLAIFALAMYVYVSRTCDCSWSHKSCLPLHPGSVPYYSRWDCPLSSGGGWSADVREAMLRNAQDVARIKDSVLNELLSLEEKRNALLVELGLLRSHAANMHGTVQTMVRSLNRLKMAIVSAQQHHRDIVQQNYPEVYLPLRLSDMVEVKAPPVSVRARLPCSLDLCWNFAHCPLTGAFTISVFPAVLGQPSSIGQRALSILQQSRLFSVSDQPCVQVFVVSSTLNDVGDAEQTQSNRLFLHIGEDRTNYSTTDSGHLLASSWSAASWSPAWHVVTPHLDALPDDCSLERLPPLCPARRQYLLSVFDMDALDTAEPAAYPTVHVKSVLRSMHSRRPSGELYVASACRSGGQPCWSTAEDREAVLRRSTFTLIFQPDLEVTSSPVLQTRLAEALAYGAVPVLLGSDLRPPFEEVLDWRRALLRIPIGRVTELQFLLRSLSDGEILELRRQGRQFWQHYLCNKQTALETVLHVLRQRLLIAARPAEDVRLVAVYNRSNPMPVSDIPPVVNTLDGTEFLGPLEEPQPSLAYHRNYSHVWLHSYDWWNVYMTPFHLYANSPFLQPLPSEAKFTGSHFGFRPIDGGRGGSGKEFSKALGGNFPKEQFTVVILTHKREQVLIQALLRLADLPYLNKVIVVWNGDQQPSDELVWPKLNVPIEVLQPGTNSLNNRFLPFAQIETEAVLSIDDDVQLRHDEIIFAFRVWREFRHRIVGFPARFHSWDPENRSWYYNSSHSCELSMVLTGAAFIHKHYLHLYTHWMPEAARQLVDAVFNCEDLAMNFLVSHVTKAPPIKVTSRWTFSCPTCTNTLSNDDEHYVKRHKCMEQLTRLYGYNPLLNTQFRVDSVLFKTKIPANHQKCFKFV